MARQSVEVTRLIPRPIDAVWAVLSDFRGLWHPAISTSRIVTDHGKVTRAFTATDGGTYREQLTYLSHSGREFRYRMIDGIPGIQGYTAQVTATPKGRKTKVIWRAQVSGPKARIKTVAQGSEAIFALGMEALATAPVPAPRALPKPAPSIERLRIDKTPALSCLATPAALASPDTLVLCLHGIGGLAENWRPQLKALGGRFPMAALDMRGYGESALGLRPAEIGDLCDDILAVADAFSARQLILVGLSLGSWLATSFAMRHPERLAGLVLSGGCTGMSEAPKRERKAFLAARLTPLNAGKSPADFAPDVVKIIAGPKAGRAVKSALSASMASIPTTAYRDALITFAAPNERFDFAAISCPVLMMTGAHDRLAPPAEIAGVAERIFNAQGDTANLCFETIADAGHLCNLENPQDFNKHLNHFLSRTVAHSTTRQRGQKRHALQQRILASALAEFAATSFDGASMDRIARAADTSKPTLYRHFKSKEGLFRAVLDQGRNHILTPLEGPDGDMIDQLWEFAWTYADFVLRPDMLSLARLILGEAERHPEHTRLYHDRGPGQALRGIQAYLGIQCARGRLDFDDAETAAQDLWSLILSGPRDFHLHNLGTRPDRIALCQSITRGLVTFLRAYATGAKRDIQGLKERAAELEKRLSL